MISSMEFNLRRSGLTMEAMGLSMDRMREEYRPTALKRVKATLILEKVARDNAVEVTQEDMENRMMEMAREMGQPPEAIANFYNQGNMLDNLRHSLLQEKTLNFLVENAKITDAAISAEDLKEADGGEAEDNA